MLVRIPLLAKSCRRRFSVCQLWIAILTYAAAAGEVGQPHKGATADWDTVAKTGVQHFKMVLPEDGSEYKWSTDPELKEVQKLNMFDYSKKFVVVCTFPQA